MKARLCTFLLIPAFAGMTFGETITLQLSPKSQPVLIGQNISTQVDISGLGLPPAAGAFDLTVAYNSSILSLTGVGFGLLLGDPTLFEALTATSTSTGMVEFAEVSLLSSTELNALQTPNFALATLSFQATGAGTAAFSLVGGVVDDAFGNKLVQIPEPPSVWMAGFGLIGLFFAIKKAVD